MERIPQRSRRTREISRESKENLVLVQLGLLFFFFLIISCIVRNYIFFHRIYQAYRPDFRSAPIGDTNCATQRTTQQRKGLSERREWEVRSI